MKRHCSPQDLLKKMRFVAEKMVAHHDCEHLAASVLHELCDPECFPIERIAFFVDNPDFNRFKGVAGIVTDARMGSCSIWDDQQSFSNRVLGHPFHQRVRSWDTASVQRNGRDWSAAAHELEQFLAADLKRWQTFSVKHGNHGIVVYELVNGSAIAPDYLEATVALLGLCPVV